MDGFFGVSGGGGGSSGARSSEMHRETFNSAYSSLECTIRNFSKEKLMYEQTVEALKNQLAIAKANLQKSNSNEQELIADNEKFLSMFEESENQRVSLEAMIASIERKLEIIAEAVEGFERVERDIFNRYEGHEEFSYSLKHRQVQMFQWVAEEKKQNEQFRKVLMEQKSKIGDLERSLHEAKASSEKQLSNHTQEKLLLQKNLEEERNQAKLQIDRAMGKTSTVMDENDQLKTKCTNLEEEKSSLLKNLEEANTALDNLNITSTEKAATLMNEIEQVKTKCNNLEEEKTTLVKNLEEEKSCLLKNLEEANTTLDNLNITSTEKAATLMNEIGQLKTKCTNLEEEKTTLLKNLEEEKSCLLKNLEEANTALDNLNFTSTAKAAALMNEIDQLKTKCTNLEEEKSSFLKNLEEANTALDNLNITSTEKAATLMNEIGQFKTKCTNLEEEKSTLLKKLEEANTALDNLNLTCTEKAAALMNEIDQFKANCTNLEKEKASLQKNLEESNKDLDNLNLTSTEKAAALMNEIDQFRTKCTNLEEEKSSLQKNLEEVNTALGNLNITSTEKTATLMSEIDQLKTKCTEMGSSLIEKNEAFETDIRELTLKFEKEKSSLVSGHAATIEELNMEIMKTKLEHQGLIKKYQSQKEAIGKLMQDTGIRPISLPNPREMNRAPKSSQDMNISRGFPEGTFPSTPKATLAPIRTRTPTRSESTRPSSILKRPKSDSDKSKNVSFGPTQVSDFIISSSSDNDSISPGDLEKPTKVVSGKKAKLDEWSTSDDTKTNSESKNDSDDEWIPFKPQKQAPKQRRIRGILGPKAASTP